MEIYFNCNLTAEQWYNQSRKWYGYCDWRRLHWHKIWWGVRNVNILCGKGRIWGELVFLWFYYWWYMHIYFLWVILIFLIIQRPLTLIVLVLWYIAQFLDYPDDGVSKLFHNCGNCNTSWRCATSHCLIFSNIVVGTSSLWVTDWLTTIWVQALMVLMHLRP
jgi:hypothetical protein